MSACKRPVILILPLMMLGCSASLPAFPKYSQAECKYAGDIGCFNAASANAERGDGQFVPGQNTQIADDVQAILQGMQQARQEDLASTQENRPTSEAPASLAPQDR